MSIKLMSLVWDMDLTSAEKLVLLSLADQANDAGVQCWPSIDTIARRSGHSTRTVQRAIISLSEKGHLTQNIVAGKGAQYHVHPRHSVTPDKVSPVTNVTLTPDTVSPKPSRTIKPSSVTRAKPIAYPSPEGVPDATWRDFLASPKRRAAGMSDTAYAGIKNRLTELAEHGFPPGDMIALAVEQGWRTVKLEWVQEQQNGRTTQHRRSSGYEPRPDPILAMRRAASAAIAAEQNH